MTSVLHDVGRRGRLDLTFAPHRGKTVVQHSYCEVPFKITRMHDSSRYGLPQVILMQCTAGLFGGDVVESSIVVESGARVLITQQSATKVHPANGSPAKQNTAIRVQSGGELSIVYDALIPFSGSRLNQTMSIEVADGARVCFWDGIMAGRIHMGEKWQFDELSSETSVRLNGRIIYLDRYRLQPADCSPEEHWAMRNCTYLGVGLCFDQTAENNVARLQDVLPEAGVDEPFEGLTVVRALAREGRDYHCYRDRFVTAIC